MKQKLMRFIAGTVCFLLAFSLSGCSSGTSEQITSAINGTWQGWTETTGFTFYVYNDDGTFQYYNITMNPDIANATSTHVNASATGTYTHEEGSTKVYINTDAGETLVYNIDLLNDSEMDYVNGETRMVCNKIDWNTLNWYLSIQQ